MKSKSIITLITLSVWSIHSCKNNAKQADNETQTEKAVEIERDNTQFVDPFIGTGEHGHNYPGATRPHGMVQLSPDTDTRGWDWTGGYHYTDSSIIGFSHTHLSGTGVGDKADVLVMPMRGGLKLESGTKDDPDSGYRSRFSHDMEMAETGYYAVDLLDYGIKAELTCTDRCGMHRYTFPQSDEAYFIIDLEHFIYQGHWNIIWSHIRIENDSTISGYRMMNGWAATRYLYFTLEFSKPFMDADLVIDGKTGDEKPGRYRMGGEAYGKKLKAWAKYQTTEGEQILVKASISAVDVPGAKNNLAEEIPHWDFDQVRKEAKQDWMEELAVINAKADEETMKIFYTSLYHAHLGPILFMDADGRYRGLDGQVHQAEGFTNYATFSLWDTYRALHPLFTIIQPDKVGDMVTSMLAHADQSVYGLLPKWSFGGNETWCMIGYHATPVIADAMLKGIEGFDYEKAYQASVHTATYGPLDGLEHYMKYNYVPIDLEHEAASKTLEYAVDDWCIAMMAKKLGHEEDGQRFLKRSTSYKNIWDSELQFMRAKNSDGSWREPFDPFFTQYGSDFTEGNSWQYSWHVQHDVDGLIELFGSPEAFIRKLDTLFVIEKEVETEVHDMTGLIGQYAHGNEPSHHIAYFYNYVGQAWKSQELARRLMKEMYQARPEGISGNEDFGQMSAWYIFSAMGFYPVNPCNSIYAFGSPAVEEASIQLPGGKRFVVKTENYSPANIYIQSVQLNGNDYKKSWISHSDIMKGGELLFVLGPEPNMAFGADPASYPPQYLPGLIE